MKMKSYSNLLEHVCEYAEEAGKLIQSYYVNKNYTVTQKADKTPVTQADWEAHLLLSSKLKALASYEVVSEESHKAEHKIPEDQAFWLVDPMDGTKEFINRTGDFTVNIALIEGKYPVIGVIYVPTTGELFYASAKHGAFKRFQDGREERLHTRSFKDRVLHVLVSRRQNADMMSVQKKWAHAQVEAMGSSLKYCRIAEAYADIYVRKLRTFEWDTAAAQCILEEAGGKICTFDGERLHYRKLLLENKELVALGDANANVQDYI